jgi:hypothetical protein
MRADQSTIWKRRAVLMAVVGLMVAVPVTVLLREGDGQDEPESALEPIDAQIPEVGRVRSVDELGVKLRRPRGWSEKNRGEVVELSSADRAVRVAISAPGPAADADQIHGEVLAGLRSTYGGFEVLGREENQKLGELKSRVTSVSATVPEGKGGGDQRILVSTAPGDKRAYVVVLFTPAEGAESSILEAQALINELRFVD